MNNVSGHLAILAGAGVAAALLSAVTAVGRITEASAPDQTAVVVALPQRSNEPAVRPPARSQPAATALPGDRTSLVRALQGELKRVGCYDGDIGGVWNAPSRAAMKAFTERVNATLPVDKPDQILLALVQGHRGRACGSPSGATIRDAEKPAPRDTAAAGNGEPKPVIVSPPVLVIRKPVSPPSEPRPRMATQEPAAPVAPIAPANQDAPTPAVGVYEQRPHHASRPLPPAPPKPVEYARSLLRKLQRAAEAVW